MHKASLAILLIAGALIVSALEVSHTFTLSTGKIRCTQKLTRNSFACRGLPYGDTTAGSNRYKPPSPVKSWNETIDATNWGPGCISFHRGVDVAPIQSEDCLNLNVFAPVQITNGLSKVPVMVFFYGGGFQEGMAQGPFEIYDGSYYAETHNVVVVTVNYRLGVLGYLVTDEVTGNAGLLDQRLALQWVQKNIDIFKGDPDRVTIFGESAGGMSVGFHLMSPGSQGLFHNAIIQSNPVGLRYMTNDRAVLFGMEYCRVLGCIRSGRCDTTCIQQADMANVEKASKAATGNMTIYIAANYDHWLDGILGFKPTIDGKEFPGYVIPSLDKGQVARSDVNVMVGATSSEAIPFICPRKTPEPIDMALFHMGLPLVFGDKRAKPLLEYYGPKYKDALLAVVELMTDVLFRCSAQKFNSAYQRAGAQSWFYRFDHVFSQPEIWTAFGFPELCRTKVCHTAELPFTFHKTDLRTPEVNVTMSTQERKLADMMTRYWVNFAYTGNPNKAYDGTLEPIVWPAYTEQGRQGIRFEGNSTAAEDSLTLCKMWDEVGYDILVSGTMEPLRRMLDTAITLQQEKMKQ